MSILQLCDEVPAAVKPTTTVADTIVVMLEKHVGAVGVVDDQGIVAGIFTERDVLRKLALSGRDPAKVEVHEMMTTPVIMATTEMTAGEALDVMVERHFRHLPIVDRDGKLLGMLSIRNLLQSEIDNLRQQMDSMEHYVSNDGPGGD